MTYTQILSLVLELHIVIEAHIHKSVNETVTPMLQEKRGGGVAGRPSVKAWFKVVIKTKG